MAQQDPAGVAKARAIETDNQYEGRGKKGFVHKFGTRGTGMNGRTSTTSGQIANSRPLKPNPQH